MTAAFPTEAMRRLDTMRHVTVRPDVMSAEPDPVKPGGWIVRNQATPYRIELVSAAGECSCVGFGIFGTCKHAALVRSVTIQFG